MRAELPTKRSPSIIPAPKSGIDDVPETGANPGNGISDDDWFMPVALAVFGGKEAGLHLHLATRWPRTSCYAFVARDPDQRRKPPVQFLRILFRSDHGAPFLRAFMRGCDAKWWIEHERAHDVGRDVISRVEHK